jgi:acyl-homoserine lactone acylase PvdQ
MSEDPASPHFNDLTILYSRKQYKPVYYTWEELEDHIESDITLDVPKVP